MNIKNIMEKDNFKLLTDNVVDKEINGLYCCDLLSWVMAHGKQGNAWITVQTHMNIVAVASLLELSCIIIPESIEVDEETIDKANEEDILIFSTHLSAYEIFCEMYQLGLR